MENTWEGEISKTGKLPEMKTFHPLDRTVSPSLPSQEQVPGPSVCLWEGVCCLRLLHETGSLASVYTGRGLELSLVGFPTRVPRNSVCSAEKCRLFR